MSDYHETREAVRILGTAINQALAEKDEHIEDLKRLLEIADRENDLLRARIEELVGPIQEEAA